VSSISVIIPAFNAERFIEEAVASALQQTLPPSEVIVVNDGSSDRTTEVCRGMERVRVLEIPHSGVSAARNAGIAASSGTFLAFLDADDIWLPMKLEKQLHLLNSRTKLGIAVCRQTDRFEGGIPPWFRGPTDGGSEVGTVPSNWLIRRDVWLRVGQFNTSLTHSEDTDWWARASDLGVPWEFVDEPLVVHRIHRSNASGNAPAVADGVLRALRDSVARKRAASP
jgi:glycosyltransferase involved in cell wall biosynthesis